MKAYQKVHILILWQDKSYCNCIEGKAMKDKKYTKLAPQFKKTNTGRLSKMQQLRNIEKVGSQRNNLLGMSKHLEEDASRMMRLNTEAPRLQGSGQC